MPRTPKQEASQLKASHAAAEARKYYHATSAKNVASIMRSGLKSRIGDVSRFMGRKTANVSLTTNLNTAQEYGRGGGAYSMNKQYAVFEVEQPEQLRRDRLEPESYLSSADIPAKRIRQATIYQRGDLLRSGGDVRKDRILKIIKGRSGQDDSILSGAWSSTGGHAGHGI
jgi:hypothetical protein